MGAPSDADRGPDRSAVVASVTFQPVPTEAPPDLRPYVRPLGGPPPEGWELDPVRFTTAAPVGSMGSISRRFLSWRRQWVARFPLGERATLAQFADMMANGGLRLLGSLGGELPLIWDDLASVASELDVCGQIAAAAPGEGWQFCDERTGTVIRIAAVAGVLHRGEGPDGDWEVSAVEGWGIRVRDRDTIHTVCGWSIDRGGLLVRRADGTELHLEGGAARGLSQLAPTAVSVNIASVPLAEAWKPLCGALRAAWALAAEGGFSIRIDLDR